MKKKILAALAAPAVLATLAVGPAFAADNWSPPGLASPLGRNEPNPHVAPRNHGGSAEDQAATARANEQYDRMYRLPDWRAYGLYAPPRGYGWYRYGESNRYALVRLGNGRVARVLVR